MGTTKFCLPDTKLWTPQASLASPNGGQDIENFLSEPCAELRPRPLKGSNKQFTKSFCFKFRILSTGFLKQQSPSEIAARDFLSKI